MTLHKKKWPYGQKAETLSCFLIWVCDGDHTHSLRTQKLKKHTTVISAFLYQFLCIRGRQFKEWHEFIYVIKIYFMNLNNEWSASKNLYDPPHPPKRGRTTLVNHCTVSRHSYLLPVHVHVLLLFLLLILNWLSENLTLQTLWY